MSSSSSCTLVVVVFGGPLLGAPFSCVRCQVNNCQWQVENRECSSLAVGSVSHYRRLRPITSVTPAEKEGKSLGEKVKCMLVNFKNEPPPRTKMCSKSGKLNV